LLNTLEFVFNNFEQAIPRGNAVTPTKNVTTLLLDASKEVDQIHVMINQMIDDAIIKPESFFPLTDNSSFSF